MAANDRAWMAAAACRAVPEEVRAAFHSREREEREVALAVCGTCQVVAECGEYADSFSDVSGVWGGRFIPERVMGEKDWRAEDRAKVIEYLLANAENGEWKGTATSIAKSVGLPREAVYKHLVFWHSKGYIQPLHQPRVSPSRYTIRKGIPENLASLSAIALREGQPGPRLEVSEDQLSLLPADAGRF